MLRVLGHPKRLCNGLTRRDALWAGGLSLFGLRLSDLLASQASPENHARSFGRAKACILLYLYGSPSQIELADQKPNAPVEVRGEFQSIRSTLPGCDVCELLPNTARVMDKVTVVRSLTHPYPIHGVAYATTGATEIDVVMELSPRDARHWPFVGSAVAYVEERRRPGVRPVPDNVALPWAFSSKRTGEVARAGPYGGFLGPAYDPQFTTFHGDATARITKTLAGQSETFDEPYVAIRPNCRFSLGDATELPVDLTLDRLDRRRSLLAQFEDARRTGDGRAGDRHRERAYALIANDRVRQALDVTREPIPLRERYGMTVFGQGALAARRLVEAGSRFVTVFWDEFGFAASGWDTHWEHFPRMKNELMPGFDLAFSGLVSDLEQRGLLDETLVVCLSEHGRTPKIQNVPGGGRDHWSQAYSGIFAGGGVARGRVVGKTDNIGGTVVDRPVSPKDVLATIYHLLGIESTTVLFDRTHRPHPLTPSGSVIAEMLA